MRSALLDSAARLFGERGVDAVSLRDVARAADVQLALIGRYVGTRDDLIHATFLHLTEQLVGEIEANPLGGHGFERDTVMGRWTVMVTHFSLHGELPHLEGPNPISALASVIEEHFGLDEPTARVRAAQVGAMALGWRLFEGLLASLVDLDDVPFEDLRADVTRINRQIGSTPWPTPDPPTTGGAG